MSPYTSFRAQEFLDAFHYAQGGMATQMQLGKLRIFYRDKKWRKSIRTAQSFIESYVDKAIEQRHSTQKAQNVNPDPEESPSADEEDDPERTYVLLHELAKETDNRIELRNTMLHVFLAGHEASAVTIGHAIFRLCRNPSSWGKLRAEVLAAGDAPFTYESLKSLQYLQFTVKESKSS
jgi:cytochrome P450